MGVPKFYRWISERYPCLSQVVKDYQIPEFDNFYLDMNGIIHTCSHPNDDDPSFRISEDKIFSSIFTYLEALFRIIKPQKVMFLAVDGVAPRAKMNQQRGRRFRSAKEAQDVVRKALQKGQILPAEPRFDSNCITPGTEFMARLHKHLKYFVAKKLSSDPTWQKVEVVLSGHDVPGEGEHKIMDYIRHQKACPDYDPNTRHCLYGLDADLIMLGLLSHEPHFSLLREEVRFGKSQKKQTSPDTITFHLLHLSILREYLDFEFQPLKGKIPFGYDLEKIIDDWVLMGFLVGNDFLPNLPNFHIRQDALPFLYTKYMEVLPTLDGYINNGGELHMGRFEAYLTAVSQFDYDHYSELFDDMKWLEGKGQLGPNARKKKGGSTEHAQKESPDDILPAGLADFAASGGVDEPDYDEDSEESKKIKRDLGISSLKSYFQEEDKDLGQKFSKEFTDFKATYYQQKMGFLRVDEGVLLEQAKCYVVGIQWVLHYYYSGVPSWSWFYPYHYAPFVSDIQGFSDILIEFELGKPFFPFEQLLGVLPPASKSLLPKAFQGLMINEDSPVKDFYPLVFQTDLNGKDQEWEAVVLIPFIDEQRLLLAMDTCLQHLTEEEASRNGFGKCLVCCHDGSAPTTVYPSPWPQMFPELTNCKLRCVDLPPDPFPVDKEQLVRGLCEGVKLDVHFPGFPSLKYVPHTGVLEKRGVRVFQAASKGENLFLTLLPRDMPQGCHEVAQDLVGKTLFVGWPYLVEARVWAVSNSTEKFHNVEAPTSHKSQVGGASLRREVLTESEAKQWREDKTLICRRYLERQGINVGNVELLVYAQVLQGKRFVVSKHGARGTVSLVKEWSPYPEPFLYQTIVKDITAFAPEYKERVSSLPDLFPPKSHCFIISPPHYGSLAEVLSVDLNQLRVQVKVTPKPEPDLLSIEDNRKLFVHYLPSHVVANRVGLPTLSLARITGNIQMEKGSRDNVKNREKVKIGLNWKFTKRNQEILGYARKHEGGGWTFSPEAIDILKQFMKTFPVMFRYIKANPTEDVYYEQDLFPDPVSSESISAVKEWLKALPSEGTDAVDCGSLTLDKPQIAAVEKAIYDMQRQNPQPMKYVKLRVKPSALFKPADRQGNLIPDPDAEYYLFDRVINVSTASAVPFALTGTVTGIMGASNDEGPEMYEVLFDEDFLGGLKLRCSSNRAYRLPASCLLNISHGKRLETKKVHKPRKSHTQSGTSYANAAAAYNQYDPQVYSRQGHSYHYSQSYTDYGHPSGTRVEYGSKQSGNERQNGSRSSTNGRGKAGNGIRTILMREPSDSSKRTKQPPTTSSNDDLSKAVSALSQLSMASTQPPKEPERPEQRTRDKARELSPSVAAMFSAHEKHQTSNTTTTQSSSPSSNTLTSDQDPSSSLKSMLNIGSSKPPAQKDITHKHQPRGPLLPRPPQYPQPQQMRGPIFPHGPAPVYPYGPPPAPPDPMAMLIQTSYAHGYRHPNVYHRNTPQGFVGYVEVGPKKYTGPPSTTPQDARRSAVAVANVDLNTSSYPMYPQQYPLYPVMMPQRPRYDGPPLPFYGQRPPPPRPTHHMHPYQHSGRGILSTPPFVPLQVQRKHPAKNYSPEKKPTMVTAQPSQQTVSSEEAQRLETASKDLMQSLNIVPPSTTTEQPVSVRSETEGMQGSSPISADQLEKQVEQSVRDVQQTKETIERLGGIIRAMSISDDLSEQPETVPVVEGSSPMGGEPIGDTFVQVALAGALSGPSEESGHYTVAVQPEDTAKPSISEVVVAGEIVGTTTNLESRGTSESESGAQMEQATSTQPKKPKRQLAASFMNL